jgi:hypothetical protein
MLERVTLTVRIQGSEKSIDGCGSNHYFLIMSNLPLKKEIQKRKRSGIRERWWNKRECMEIERIRNIN